MIAQSLYEAYFDNLIKGNKANCRAVVEQLSEQHTPVSKIYNDLFKPALYQVGELWEKNKISVATEHMATAITETLMIQLQPQLFTTERVGKKAVIACVANEYHQIGAKMVADMFEMNGWDGFFVGASTPANELIRFIKSTNPDVVALSLSIYFNINDLKNTLAKIRSELPDLPIIVGGQAFRWGGSELAQQFKGVQIINSINDLSTFFNQQNHA
jgi:methanogenic corrinoid protein MtbC1